MKAMILSAGRGERMRPLTDRLPKPLIPLLGRPLIEYHLRDLAEAGLTEVVINLGYRGEQIRQQLGDGRRFGLRIQYSEEGDPPLETGGGVLRALPLLGDAPFLVINADVYVELAWGRFIARGRQLPADLEAWLLMVPTPAFKTQGDFALQEQRIVEPAAPTHTFAGVSILRPSLLRGCSEGRFPLAPVLRASARRGAVGGELFQGLWSDVGTPQRLDELQARLKKPY